MNTLHIIFGLLAIACFVADAAGKTFGTLKLLPIGLALLAAAVLFV